MLGAHVSAARSAGAGGAARDGLINAIYNGEQIGAECIQIFGASPRSYQATLPTTDAANRFKSALAASSIQAVYQHGAYLVNLGSESADTLRKSITNLAAHLSIANLIGSRGVVFHVGSPNGGDRAAALERAAKAMKAVLKEVSGPAHLIMENSGSIKKIGGSISDLEYLFRAVSDSRVRICLDTAHTLESGMITEYTPKAITALIDAWEAATMPGAITVLHANDSKTPYNSQNDKHENIGDGYIGYAGFENLAKEKRLQGTCIFLEVPGITGTGPDKENMDRLKRCFSTQ